MSQRTLSLIWTLVRRALILVVLGAAIFNLGLSRRSKGDMLPSHSQTAQSAQTALILYDAPPDEPKLAQAYATMLQALLGHFAIEAKLQPVNDYAAGEIDSFATTFYLGSYYNNPLPDEFLRDTAKTKNRVVWFKYNLWQLSTPPELQFEARNGMSFVDLKGLDSEPSKANPNPGFYDTVLYKGKSLVKYYEYDSENNEVSADPDIGIVKLTNPSKAQARVMIQNSRTGNVTPYIVQAGAAQNFWYIADLPFTYIGPRDRYLVFCDILHDILGIQHAESHPALVRLEDVNAKVEFNSIKTISDYLSSRHIPFSIATIPHYKDPLGASNDGTPESIPFEQATTLQESLRYAISKGASIVMHGYTHQYGSMKNPHSGVSADDYEFWNAVANSPVQEDSAAWALGRLNSGMNEFAAAGFKPWAWEAPHYQGSPLSYQAMSERFSTTYQRVVYYTSEKPNLQAEGVAKDFEAGMFFPYVIHRDPYGQYVIPENLGNIEYDIHTIDPSSNFNYTWKDILENAEYGKVVRDGFGSFFFHPFWIDPDFNDLHAWDDFKNLIDGITALGYQWTDAQTLAKPTASPSR